MQRQVIIYFFIIGCFFSCQQVNDQELVIEPLGLMEIPDHFPAIEFPDDNGFTLERWELGKKLFYDPIMSSTGDVSCATCHDPALGFTDGLEVSIGVEDRMGFRNAPSLANVAYQPYLLREGALSSIEMQVLVPLQEHHEFDLNILDLVDRLKEDETYRAMSQEAYNREPDAFVITRALANFERSLISGQSRYDAHLTGDLTLNQDELKGEALFFSERLACGHCHGGHNFSNYDITNNGLYEEYPDVGKFRLTNDSTDLATFKTPSLRNVAITAPYMHDGSLQSIEQVIEHYAVGGKAHINKHPLIDSFEISDEEKTQLMAFLHCLTDSPFINNKIFRDE